MQMGVLAFSAHSPHDGEAVPEGAQTLVDVVGLLLPGAGGPSPGAAAALAPREVHDPEARVFTLLADELDLVHDETNNEKKAKKSSTQR